MVSAFDLYKEFITPHDRRYWVHYTTEDQQVIIEAAKRSMGAIRHVVSAYESDIVGIAISDRSGVVLEANTKCLALLGKTRHDLTAQRVTRMDFMTPEIREKYPNMVDDVVNKHKRVCFKKDLWGGRKNGEKYTVLMEVRHIPATGQNVIYLIDETNGISRHDEHRRHRDMFEQLANSVPFMIWTADAEDGSVTYCNDRWYEYTAMDRNLVNKGQSWLDALPAEFRGVCSDRWKSCLKTGKEFQAEFKLVNRQDGTYRWHMARAVLCRNVTSGTETTSGEPVWFATCIDIHDQKTAMLRSEIAEAQFSHLLDNLPIIAWGCDASGKCNLTRGSALKDHAIKDGDMLGYDLFDYYQRNNPTVVPHIRRALAGESFGISTRHGEHWYQTMYSPVQSDTGGVAGMLAISIDVSDSKNREEAERTGEVAKRALKANTEFVASISHEIRTPLNGIIGMADLILADTISELHRPFMGLLKSSGRTLLSIVNELLDLSKLNAGKMSLECIDMDLRSIVQSVVQTTKVSLTQPSIQLITTVDPLLPEVVRGDPTKIQQIVTNLTNNAVKFTKVGSVEIKVTVTSGTPTTPSQPLSVRLSVIDTGCGVSEEFRKKLFSDYCQEDASIARQYGGTGLGLAICQKLAVLMNGSISVESEKGKGTTFFVDLPLMCSASVVTVVKSDSHSKMTPEELGTTRAMRILVAEDNSINQIIVERMLTRMGCAFDIVADGEQVLAKLQTETYGIIFMDCEMPILDGFAATRAIRSLETINHVTIIALTADAVAETRQRCLDAGMDDYLTKPATFKAVADMIAKWSPAELATGESITASGDASGSSFFTSKTDDAASGDGGTGHRVAKREREKEDGQPTARRPSAIPDKGPMTAS
ncbi:hypothetical protein HKX48_008394 [Thoreauomyces humboldtii]|nr:hypothetical protein HKX48_008394 [Thoreauomyces humboldtii]